MNYPDALRRLLAPVIALIFWAGVGRSDNWPQWRGPQYDGVSQETHLPAAWSPTHNILWKLPLPGMGSSTPAVWGDHIFLTSEDGQDLVLLCISTNGQELWKRKLGSGRRRVRGDEGNEASSSPSTDGNHVYAFVGSGDLACFDFEGNEAWKFNVQDRYGKFDIMFGMHTTPLLYEDRLYLQIIHSGGAWVIALDKDTGKEVWKVARPSDGRDECKQSYASPCLWHNGRDAYLVVHGNDYATAHRLSDGGEIWRLGGLNPPGNYNPTLRFIASPVAVPDLIVVPSAKNGPVVGVRPDAKGLIVPGSPAELWRRPHNTPDVPSPLVQGGLVYLCRESGSLICLDAKTGQENYEHRIHPGRYRASPVYADGKIYLIARDGTVSVVKAGPNFDLLATNSLADDMTASLTTSNGRIYLRGFNTLYAVSLQGK